MRAATRGAKELSRRAIVPGRHAKISDFYVGFVVDENVFKLEVAVGNIVTVAIIDCADDLLKVSNSFGGRSTAFAAEVIEELSALDVFEDQVKAGGRFPDVVEFHDVGVVNELHNDNFAFHCKEVVFDFVRKPVQRDPTCQGVLRDDLDGGVLSSLGVTRNSNMT